MKKRARGCIEKVAFRSCNQTFNAWQFFLYKNGTDDEGITSHTQRDDRVSEFDWKSPKLKHQTLISLLWISFFFVI